MRIIPLGGADEVGASSTIVEFGNVRLLVDAGIRIGEQGGNQLPDLSRIKDEAGPLDGIFLTHAHMDHSGALPLVHMAYPDVPIYMTPATAAVVRILLSDSLRLMDKRYQHELEIPLYPPEAVASCLGVIRPIPFDYPISSISGEAAATFHPAGHILGASSISLSGRSGSILISGDISVTEQRTVPGMLPPSLQHDVVMVESTYGDRMHAHRPTQENNLIRTVADVIESGGKVLFPAFAVGRAQEVILILQHAIERGELPEMPVFVDGLVQAVCDTYSRFPTYLQQHLRSRLKRGQNPFFPSDGTVFRVRSAQQRDRVLEGGACCIIASSGMMTGGPSAFYASHLVDSPKNMIAITGYQDEEAPGRRLLEMAEAHPSKRKLRIKDRVYKVRCRVERYSLSAHADSFEIAGLVRQMDPAQGVVLVHGDEGARGSLASTMEGFVGSKVYTPTNGEILQFSNKKKVFFSPPRTGKAPRIGGTDQALDMHGLSHLHQSLWAETGRQGLYRLADLHARWYGPNQDFNEGEADSLQTMLEDSDLFVSDHKRPHLFRLRSLEPTKKKERPSQGPTEYGVLEMNRALQCVAKYFQPEDGLYKKGARQENRQLLLFFRFPQIAEEKFADKLEELGKETGWSVVLNDMPHHAALDEVVRRLLPEEWDLMKNPSIMHDRQTVRLTIFRPDNWEEDALEWELSQLCDRYLEETGYRLEAMFKKRRSPKPAAGLSDGPMEINQAYQYIEESFANCVHRPYKKSKKGGQIVLSFLTPEIGEHYKEKLDTLSEETGWPIEINPEPNLYGIKQEVRLLIPDSWGMKRDPAPIKTQRVVRVRVDEIPEPQQVEEVAQQVFVNTSFHLELSAGD
ncbi:MAG: MBL fold metallo-hydrolase [Deltaproteobacteria bacterium]|nr:MAG: MBL fold metallo-hydrolase [Deltaproteobacteria bacterium]